MVDEGVGKYTGLFKRAMANPVLLHPCSMCCLARARCLPCQLEMAGSVVCTSIIVLSEMGVLTPTGPEDKAEEN